MQDDGKNVWQFAGEIERQCKAFSNFDFNLKIRKKCTGLCNCLEIIAVNEIIILSFCKQWNSSDLVFKWIAFHYFKKKDTVPIFVFKILFKAPFRRVNKRK